MPPDHGSVGHYLIGESHEHILFIEIGNLSSRDLFFGPVQ